MRGETAAVSIVFVLVGGIIAGHSGALGIWLWGTLSGMWLGIGVTLWVLTRRVT